MDERIRILVIDDDRMSLRVMRRLLEKAGMEGTLCGSGQEAFSLLDGEYLPDLILLDVHMPDVSGFEILRKLKQDYRYRDVPVVFLTGDEDVKTESQGLSEGAADFIRKPFSSEVLLRRLRNIIELSRLHQDMETEIRAKTEKLQHAYLQIVEALAASVDAKDRYTHGHSSRVALYAREIARRAGFSEKEQGRIFMMGLLHDVGKIGIQDAIINKNGKLTDEEYTEIKTHPAVGYRILKKITDMPDLATGARWHHERYDGKGYPDGLSGKDIPEAARIIAIADTYDAMTSNRSYRGILPQDKVRAEIDRCKGTQFDPDFAEIMLEMIDEDREYRMREETSDE